MIGRVMYWTLDGFLIDEILFPYIKKFKKKNICSVLYSMKIIKLFLKICKCCCRILFFSLPHRHFLWVSGFFLQKSALDEFEIVQLSCFTKIDVELPFTLVGPNCHLLHLWA